MFFTCKFLDLGRDGIWCFCFILFGRVEWQGAAAYVQSAMARDSGRGIHVYMHDNFSVGRNIRNTCYEDLYISFCNTSVNHVARKLIETTIQVTSMDLFLEESTEAVSYLLTVRSVVILRGDFRGK